MAAPPPSPVSGRSGIRRALPLLSILAYLGLALVTVAEYEADAFFAPFCYGVPGGVACAPMRSLWLSLATLWSSSAVTLAGFFVIGFAVDRRGRDTETPERALLAYGVFVSSLGILWFWVSQAAPWGRAPYSLAYALLFTYVTGALFLFGLVFLGGGSGRGRSRGWTVGLAAINEFAGLVLGSLLAFSILFPPVVG